MHYDLRSMTTIDDTNPSVTVRMNLRIYKKILGNAPKNYKTDDSKDEKKAEIICAKKTSVTKIYVKEKKTWEIKEIKNVK